MAKVEIYTGPFCGYCARAKRLLNSKGVGFVEYEIQSDPKLRTEMLQRAKGARTVPQIFINDKHIGGSDELAELERAGKLMHLLAS